MKLLGVEFLIYPLDLHKPINLTLTMNNTGDRITSIIQYIDIDWYGYLLNCGWHNLFSIPNVDGCSQLGNCPQEPGLVVSHVNIDTAPYEGAIDLLPIDQVNFRIIFLYEHKYTIMYFWGKPKRKPKLNGDLL